MSAELLVEIWDTVKYSINPKERQQIAEQLITMFDEYGYADGFELEYYADDTLREAINNYYEKDEIEESGDDEEGL